MWHALSLPPHDLPFPSVPMKYPLYVSGAQQKAGANQHENTNRHEYQQTNTPVVRRFPPSIQYLTRSEQFIEEQIQSVALRTFKSGKTIDEVCSAMYKTALSLGYIITIGLQEVYSSNMPSFPSETVMSSLIMVDFTPAGAKARS